MKINLPNRLTLIRIALIPVFVVLMSFEELWWAQVCAAVVFAAACVTDYLDGDIARKRNLVTNFGKFADPIADKLLVMSAYVVLVGQGRMPAWVCIAFLAREFTVSGFRLVAAGGGKIMAAGKLGKIKTFTQMVAVILLILAPAFTALDPFGHITADVMMYVALFMTIWSGADYIIRNRQFIQDM
jgi:CDP-diacylglycerol--glycerol-3-phosphate 3-phosphatidyltransferase